MFFWGLWILKKIFLKVAYESDFVNSQRVLIDPDHIKIWRVKTIVQHESATSPKEPVQSWLNHWVF